MKRLHASALAAVMTLVLVASAACGTTGNSGPWGGSSSYGASPRGAYYVPYGAYPRSGYYAPHYGSYPRYSRSYRRGYRYPGDNERCSDRRESCQKWSSKRGRYIPDYGETGRQYGEDAERDQRQRHTR
jgi:hypothetical protein